ncbi:hypothetical protein CYMTET_54935 [Cymbomonas tetramitiformis]|uniref:RRM domain-containing protein n=1 Tax=Cymbomonas tetramitiformis TaxID=36881 RepID=A0AAE0BF39_9CHLO|nr:hypothetical protein CYMTET_54935 [Cymbomonas tetramitiformis]
MADEGDGRTEEETKLADFENDYEKRERSPDRGLDRGRDERDRDRDRDGDKHRRRSRDRGDRDRDRDRHKSSRRRSRSRDRHRSSRRRSRSRSRSRGRKSQFDAPPSANTALLLQQQQQQQQVLAQQLLMQQMAQIHGQPNLALSSGKKQREVYVGNLTVGLVQAQMLRELCNGALAPLCPDAATNPPVVNVSMDSEGKFAFVEMRTEELATAALHLDKVELCGRNINVGRPKGYIDPALTGGLAAGAAPGMGGPPLGMTGGVPQGTPGIQQLGGMGSSITGALVQASALATTASGITGAPPGGANALLGMLGGQTSAATVYLCLQNIVTAAELLDAEERAEIAEDVKEECAKLGAVVSVCVPTPPQEAIDKGEAGRVYVHFQEQAGAIAAQRSLNNRTFSGNKVVAQFVPQEDFIASDAGEWVDPPPPPAPAEGVIKLRGLPFTASKQDIVLFFQGNGLQESGVKIIMGMDGRPTGEAYAVFEGAGVDIRGALAKDRQMLGNRYVELFLSSKDELDRRQLSGTMMI